VRSLTGCLRGVAGPPLGGIDGFRDQPPWVAGNALPLAALAREKPRGGFGSRLKNKPLRPPTPQESSANFPNLRVRAALFAQPAILGGTSNPRRRSVAAWEHSCPSARTPLNGPCCAKRGKAAGPGAGALRSAGTCCPPRRSPTAGFACFGSRPVVTGFYEWMVPGFTKEPLVKTPSIPICHGMRPSNEIRQIRFGVDRGSSP